MQAQNIEGGSLANSCLHYLKTPLVVILKQKIARTENSGGEGGVIL